MSGAQILLPVGLHQFKLPIVTPPAVLPLLEVQVLSLPCGDFQPECRITARQLDRAHLQGLNALTGV